MSTFCVWTQIIDDTTGIENIDSYGSVHDVEAEYEAEDESGTPNKQFCDGQTSKTPPRYAQDRMIGIYTRSEESARTISDFLRNDLSSRINSRALVIPLPSWYVPTVSSATGAMVASELNLLRLRTYYEFRTLPTSQIDEALDATLANGIDNMSVSGIIKQMRGRLT